MKYAIKNLIGSPYNVPTAEGVVHIPAHGEVTAELNEIQIQQIKLLGYFIVSEGSAAKAPVVVHVEQNDEAEPKKRGRPKKEA